MIAALLAEHLFADAGDTALTSVDKLHRLREAAMTFRPTGGMEAVALLALRPMLRTAQLPTDPHEADQLLDQGIELLRALQSDPGSIPEPDPEPAEDPEA